MTSPTLKRRLSSLSFIFLLLLSFITSACTAGTQNSLKEAFRSDAEKGYVEFYCMRCMTGWAVFKKVGEDQINLAQKVLGRRVKDSVEMPSREKKIRIALPVGPHEITIRLLPYTRVDTVFNVKDGPAKEIQVMVDQNRLTPVRLDFMRINNRSFSWTIKQGDPIPLSENANTIETYTVFLNSSNWDTRWYATQFFGEMQGEVPELALARLEKLSGWDTLQKCLKKTTVVECESLREEAGIILRKIAQRQY